ncbi:MAG TPA: DUF3592 domain-containing protein [Pyrinomonadaceae bacterium]|nr:DUF3592 domain-containing protein [Pyrinomonadaceae bacterium]
MALFNRFRRQKEDPEAARRTRLLRNGRIAEGAIFDVISDDSHTITQIFYSYSIGGVEYESSQLLNHEQRLRQSDYSPGARITVRYDPHQPGNSIVV